ncbi:MAG TPA: hypothetical protein VII08_15665 [Myxococcales bacterium]
MSYDVIVVKPPVPAGEEAWRALESIVGESGATAPDLLGFYERLTAKFPCICSLSEDRLDEGVWSTGPLLQAFGHRAATLTFFGDRAVDVLPYIIERAASLGLLVFDQVTHQLHCPGGLRGFMLTVEDEVPVPALSVGIIEQAVDRLSPARGPSFLVVDGPHEAYAQAAGGDGAFTAEWYEVQNGTPLHWVGGLSDVPPDGEIAIPTRDARVTVRRNERLASTDVKEILGAFVQGSPRPSRFAWRRR